MRRILSTDSERLKTLSQGEEFTLIVDIGYGRNAARAGLELDVVVKERRVML